MVQQLTIAYLDHDEINYDVKDDRLKALCQYCHLNYDAKEKYRRACMGNRFEQQTFKGISWANISLGGNLFTI